MEADHGEACEATPSASQGSNNSLKKEELRLPTREVLIAEFLKLAADVEPISRYVSALETGHFVHPDGRSDDLGPVKLSLPQAALISHLCRHCPVTFSVEIGFGMGSSAAVILGTRT